jgi:predicted FMN-binding regulatory protein PaiB
MILAITAAHRTRRLLEPHRPNPIIKPHRIEAKAKLSQNRPAADVEGVITGLRERDDKEVADAVERARH